MNTENIPAMTVNEVSKLTGLSVRTLQYYDKIGLLSPSGYTSSGYRLYDDAALKKLQQIMLFRELEFPLKEIRRIVSDPALDSRKALEQQIILLKLRRDHLDDLIDLAEKLRTTGVNDMNRPDFSAFDKSRLEDYTRRAREQWGSTPEFEQSQEKAERRTDNENAELVRRTMELFAEFGEMKGLSPDDERVQAQVKKLQDFFCENFYQCTDEILAGLGEMYAAGGEFTVNIDSAGGTGTAEFVSRAIRVYCGK